MYFNETFCVGLTASFVADQIPNSKLALFPFPEQQLRRELQLASRLEH
jgi:hypothetical protein